MPMDLGVVKVVGQATKAGTLQMIRAEKGNINLSIDSSWDNEWQESLSGLESVAERVVALSVDPKLIQARDLAPFINLKTLELAFGQPQSLPKLKTLTTLYLANWNDHYAGILPACCPNLEHLAIGFFNEENLLGLRQFTQLKHLTLSYGSLKSLAGIEQLLNLEELHISMIGLEDVSALKSCPLLKILHLESHSELLEIIDLSNNQALLALRIEHMPHLKNIKIEQTATYPLEKVYLSGTKSLESLEWLSHCPHLKELALSFKPNTALTFDASKLTELTSFYGDCSLDGFSIQRLLSNTSLIQLFLSQDNAVTDFAWLTPDHQLQICCLYFAGDAIDWDQVFLCLGNDWQRWQIWCLHHLKIEQTEVEISAIAQKYGHNISNALHWTTECPLYQF